MFSLSSLITYPRMLVFGIAAMVLAVAFEMRARHIEQSGHGEMAVLQDEADLVVQSLSAVLTHPETCSEALGGFKIEPGQEQPLRLKHTLDPEAESEGVYPGASATSALRFHALFLSVPRQENMRTIINDSNDVPTELHRFAVELRTQFVDKEGRLIISPQGLDTRVLSFYVWTLPPPPLGSGEVVSCFGRDSVGVLCNDLGGYFVPGTTPYDQSCRLSLKTLRREGGRLVAAANCRVGGIVDKPAECIQFGVRFGANQIQGVSSVVPLPGDRYLCQICQ